MMLPDLFSQNLLLIASFEGLKEELSFDKYALSQMGLPNTKEYCHNTAKIANIIYKDKFGNILPDDGARYIGRGFIKCRGRANYQLMQSYLGIPLLEYPELLENRQIAWLAAQVFRPWLEKIRLEHYYRKNLNEFNLHSYLD